MFKDKDKDKTIKFYFVLLLGLLAFAGLVRYAFVHQTKLEYFPPNLHLARVFTDNILLQRNQDMVIWGKAHHGKEIKIEFKDKHYTTKSDEKDHWQLSLGKHEAGGPYEIKVKSDQEEIILSNVLVGDQWLVLGEAIVNFPLSQTQGLSQQIAATEKLTNIRYFNADLISEKTSGVRELNQEASWQVIKSRNVSNMPAIAYYLAKSQSKRSHVPIGIVKVAEDYVPLQSFLNTESEDDTPMEHDYNTLFDTALANNSEMLKLTLDKLTEGDITLLINDEMIGRINKTSNLRVFNIPASLLKSKYNKIELRVNNVDDMVQLSRDQMNMSVYLASGTKSETVLKPGHKWYYTKIPDIGAPGLMFKEMIEPILALKFQGIVIYQGDSNLASLPGYKKLLADFISYMQTHFKGAKLRFLGLRNINSYNPHAANADALRTIQRDVISAHASIKFIETSTMEFKTNAESIALSCL